MLKLERIMAMIEENFLIKTTFLNLIKMFLITFFFSHLNACIFSWCVVMSMPRAQQHERVQESGRAAPSVAAATHRTPRLPRATQPRPAVRAHSAARPRWTPRQSAVSLWPPLAAGCCLMPGLLC